MPRFVYFYFNRSAPESVRQAVPAHVHYWQNAPVREYQGGPFADHSGGLICFTAADLEEATRIVLQDPFALNDLLAEKWIKEWTRE